MKRKPTGRPKKSAKGQHRWWARAAANELRYALEVTGNGSGPAHWERQAAAWGQFGDTVCASCDPDNPAKFLRQIADELDGKLGDSYSSLDYKIYAAWWGAFIEVFALDYLGPWPYPLAEVFRAAVNGPHPTYAQWKVKFKKLWGNTPLPRGFVLQRSIKRLGFPLQKP
jgi:hypothetical protein